MRTTAKGLRSQLKEAPIGQRRKDLHLLRIIFAGV
jgi:hypothetical protein